MKMFGVDFVQSMFVTIDTSAEELLELAQLAKLGIMEEKIAARFKVRDPGICNAQATP